MLAYVVGGWLLLGLISWIVIFRFICATYDKWLSDRYKIQPDADPRQVQLEAFFSNLAIFVFCLALAPVAFALALHRVKQGDFDRHY